MAKNEQKTFPEILSSLMKERGIGVRHLARAAQISPASISEWRAGHHRPTDYEAIGRIADELGVSLSFLLRGREDRITKTPQRGVHEVFTDGEVLFDGMARIEPVEGYAKIRIHRLVLRPEFLPHRKAKSDVDTK